MTEETPVQEPVAGTGSEAPKVEAGSILDELTKLGQKASAALQQILESEQRKRAEEEIRKALHLAGERIDRLAEEVRVKDATSEIREQAARLVESVEKSKVTDEIRKSLLAGLRKLNEELTEFLERAQAEEAKRSQPEEAPSAQPADQPQA